MKILSLNEDVLSSILTYLSTHDALSLSATARELHALSTHHALSSITTKFRDPAHFKQFCLYVLADVKNRLHSVRRLEVPYEACTATALGPQFSHTVDAAAVSLLVQLLNQIQTGNLRTLLLHELKDMLKMDSRVEEALAALPHIVDLRLHDIEEHSLKLLGRTAQLHSGLRKLEISIHYRVRTTDVFPHLAKLQGVESFQLWDGMPETTTPSGDDPETPPGGYNIDQRLQWPVVRHLSIHSTRAPMSLFLHVFPNILTLSLHDLPYSDIIVHRSPMCWASLDHLSIDFYVLKHWQVTCAVHWLELRALVEFDFWYEFDEADALIRGYMSPVVFYLQVYWDVLLDWVPLIGHLRRLKCLVLEIHPRQNDDLAPRFDQTIFDQDEMFPVLGSTGGVVYIEIYFHIHSYMWGYKWTRELTRPSQASAALDADMKALSTGLARSVRSLKYISLRLAQTFSYGRPDKELRTAWWRVVGTGEDCTPVPMTVQAGEWVKSQMRVPGCDFEAL